VCFDASHEEEIKSNNEAPCGPVCAGLGWRLSSPPKVFTPIINLPFISSTKIFSSPSVIDRAVEPHVYKWLYKHQI
jgi:hypothetical protein